MNVKVKKGDTVIVIAGKDKGAKGKVASGPCSSGASGCSHNRTT